MRARIFAMFIGLIAAVASCGDDTQPVAADAAADRPPDGTISADASSSCTATPMQPINEYVFADTIDVSGDVEMTVTVPNGFLVHGHVSWESLLPDFTEVNGYALLNDTATGDHHNGLPMNLAGDGFDYEMVVPAGRYNAKFTANQSPLSNQKGFARTVYETLDVCGDVTHDIILPAVGPLTTRSVGISGLDEIGSGPWSFDLLYSTSDWSLAAWSDDISASNPTATASIDLTDDLVVPHVVARGSADGRQSPAQPQAGGSPFDLHVLPVVTVGGTLSSQFAFQLAQVICYSSTDPEPFDDPSTPTRYGVWVNLTAPGTFQFLVPSGFTCPLYAEMTSNSVGWFFVPAPTSATDVTFSNDVTRNFDVPTFSRFNVTIRLQDQQGQPLTSWAVGLESISLDGDLAGDSFTTRIATASDGRATNSVPAGRYRISVGHLQ